MKLCEPVNQGLKIAVPSHLVELARLKANVAYVTSDLKLKELELQTLPGSSEEVA